MAIVGWIVTLSLGIVLALFAAQNQQPVTIHVLGTEVEGIATWMVMVGSAAVGALMVLVISLVDRVRWFMSSRQSRKLLAEHKKMLVQRDNHIHELEQEIFRLRGAA